MRALRSLAGVRTVSRSPRTLTIRTHLQNKVRRRTPTPKLRKPRRLPNRMSAKLPHQLTRPRKARDSEGSRALRERPHNQLRRVLRKRPPSRNRSASLHHLTVRRWDLVDGPQSTRQRGVAIRRRQHRSHLGNVQATQARILQLAATPAASRRPGLRPQLQPAYSETDSLSPRVRATLIRTEPSARPGRRLCFGVPRTLDRETTALLRVHGRRCCIVLPLANVTKVVLRTAAQVDHLPRVSSREREPSSRPAATATSSSSN